MKKIIAATAFAALFAAVPAFAAEDFTNMPPSSESSGPGVKGDAGSTNGPATKPEFLDRNVEQQRQQHGRAGHGTVAGRNGCEGRARQHQWPIG